MTPPTNHLNRRCILPLPQWCRWPVQLFAARRVSTSLSPRAPGGLGRPRRHQWSRELSPRGRPRRAGSRPATTQDIETFLSACGRRDGQHCAVLPLKPRRTACVKSAPPSEVEAETIERTLCLVTPGSRLSRALPWWARLVAGNSVKRLSDSPGVRGCRTPPRRAPATGRCCPVG
jgi:hypothetical protein